MCGNDESALEVLFTRQSCRKFTSQAVLKGELEKIVNAGRLAATARNVQPWHFVVVTEPGRLKELASLTGNNGKFIADAAACIVVLCEEVTYYVEDGSAATQNLLNAAHALGLGGCWVAGDKKPYAESIVKFLDAPKNMKLVSLVPIGHPAEQTPRATKKNLAEVLHWEKI
ncbi:MAG: nitroreductase family protein [Phycisphaerae bacterium]